MRTMGTTVACLLLVAACDASPGPGSEPPSEPISAPVPNVRDSAGIRIVEYASLSGIDSTAWRIVLEDSVRIGHTGSTEGAAAYQFGRAAGAFRLENGLVVVADGHSRELRLFSTTGSFYRTAGGPGQGPGELMGMYGLFRMQGDSLVVAEGQRWTVFDPEGDFALTRRVEPEGIGYPLVVGAFHDGTLLVRHQARGQDEAFAWGSERTGTVRYSRLDRDRGIINSFGEFPQPTALSAEGVTHPLAGRSQNTVFVRVGVLGGQSARAMGDRFYWSSKGLREIQVFGLDGDLKMLLRFPELEEALRDEVAIGRVQYVQYDLPPALEAHIRSRREAMAPSPFSAFLVDDLGNFWLRDQEFTTTDTSAPALWTVLDPQGLPLAALRMPYPWGQAGSNDLTQIGPDFILNHEWDEFLVDTYMMASLERR
jgi:hypothetical protein